MSLWNHVNTFLFIKLYLLAIEIILAWASLYKTIAKWWSFQFYHLLIIWLLLWRRCSLSYLFIISIDSWISIYQQIKIHYYHYFDAQIFPNLISGHPFKIVPLFLICPHIFGILTSNTIASFLIVERISIILISMQQNTFNYFLRILSCSLKILNNVVMSILLTIFTQVQNYLFGIINF